MSFAVTIAGVDYDALENKVKFKINLNLEVMQRYKYLTKKQAVLFLVLNHSIS